MAQEAPTNATGGASSMPPPAAAPVSQDSQGEQPSQPEVAPPSAPKDDVQERVDRQIMLLTRKEREIQKGYQTLKQQQAEMSEVMKEIQEFRSLKEKAKTDPLAFTRHFGIEYKQLTDQVLNDERPTPEMMIKHLEERLENLQAERSKERQDSETKQRDQLVSTFKDGIKDYVEANGEQFELIKTFGAHDQIFSTIHAHWKETGEYLSVAEVAQHIESNMEQEAKKLLGLKKFSPKMEAKVEQALENKESTPEVARPQSKTLTNNLTSQGAPPASSKPYLRDDQSLAEAAKMLRWHDR